MTAVTVGAISTKGRPALRWHGEGFQRRRHHHPREEPCADAPCRAVPTEPAPPPMQPPPPPTWLLPPATDPALAEVTHA